MGGHKTLELAKTVMEVADVAWKAVECCNHHGHEHEHEQTETTPFRSPSEDELKSLKSENERLRRLLEENLKLLQTMSQSSSLLQDCPPDLHDRLLAAVDSGSFLKQLESLNQKSDDGSLCQFPFKEASGCDMEAAELLIKLDMEEPSWWVWITDDMIPGKVEERSGIDTENYVIVTEEYVVDAVANFMARCIVSNPKAQKMSPKDLQKTLTKALEGVNTVEKMFNIWHAATLFYTLSMWGLTLAGLYKSRAVLKLAAKGVHATGKVVLKAL